MYYVDEEQISERLRFIPYLIAVCENLAEQWNGENPIVAFAQERALHLAGEMVTDIGSLLIDGYLLREASSYEDIVKVLIAENVVAETLRQPLLELVKLRKPLVQEYMSFDRTILHPLIRLLPTLLTQWEFSVLSFMDRGADSFGDGVSISE